MAKSQKVWEEILKDSAVSKDEGGTGETAIGNYKEAPGGGKPLPKGARAPSKAWVEANRKPQPRDSEGHFTYNSANRKPLEYGPSRGTTTPPFLKGVTLTFAKKSGKGAFVALDGKKYTLPDNIKTAEDFARAFQEHVDGEGFKGFGKIEDVAKGKGGKTGTTITLGDKIFMSRVRNNKKLPPKNTFKKKDNDNTTPMPNKNSTSKTLDRSLAQSDPKKFIQDNYDEIQSIADMAQKKGKTLNVDGMVKAFADGDIDSFDEVKKAIEEA